MKNSSEERRLRGTDHDDGGDLFGEGEKAEENGWTAGNEVKKRKRGRPTNAGKMIKEMATQSNIREFILKEGCESARMTRGRSEERNAARILGRVRHSPVNKKKVEEASGQEGNSRMIVSERNQDANRTRIMDKGSEIERIGLQMEKRMVEMEQKMVNAMKDIQCEVVGLRHEYGKVKDMLDKEKEDRERLEKEIRSIKQQIDQNRKKWDQERRKLEERLKELEARMEREAERRQQGQLQEGQQEWQESTNWNEDLEYKVEEVVVKKSREVAKQEIARIQNKLEKAERHERRCNIINFGKVFKQITGDRLVVCFEIPLKMPHPCKEFQFCI